MTEPPRRDAFEAVRWFLRAAAWLAVFHVVLFFMYLLAGPQRGRDSAQGTLTLPPQTIGTFPFHHAWVNEALRLKNWRGDRADTDHGMSLPKREISSELEFARLERMCNEFGYPEKWDTIVQSNFDSDRFRRALVARAARRGVLVKFVGTRFEIAPDYEWIIENSANDVGDLALQIQQIALRDERGAQRQLHRVAASFVQSLEYRIPRETRESRAGDAINNLGVATPIEVLYNKWGDCDSKSLLFASILSHFPGQRVIFLRGLGHLFVGVRGVPRIGDHFVEVHGIKYVLIEMTAPWPIGRIPTDMWSGLRGNQFAVISLGDDPRQAFWRARLFKSPL